ncbi:MAG: GspH/FimT family pseudopilin [Pseudomonadota bacterium]|nr:GspH/FimT family pseudopilin [Pseudomonadota bacterium]
MQFTRWKRKSHRGFSLIELMVTLCIMLLLGGFALHDLIDQKRRHEMDGLQENFIDLLYSARSAAVIQSSEVIVCPLRTERSTLLARPSCGKRNQWQLGVLAFTDFNRNRRLDDNEHIVAQLPSFHTATIRWRSFRNRSYLRFTPEGLTDWQNGNFLFCDNQGAPELTRQITLNHAGRLYTAEDRDRDGIYEGSDNKPLKCR